MLASDGPQYPDEPIDITYPDALSHRRLTPADRDKYRGVRATARDEPRGAQRAPKVKSVEGARLGLDRNDQPAACRSGADADGVDITMPGPRDAVKEPPALALEDLEDLDDTTLRRSPDSGVPGTTESTLS